MSRLALAPPAHRPAARARETGTTTAAILAGLVLALFLVALAGVLMATGGAVLYTLDDPYIHLALAEELLKGHYGINPGEAASASSSILYPLLLAAGLKLGLGQAAPLALNLACTLGLVAVLARYLARLGLPPAGTGLPARLALGLALVLGLNLVGLAFTGLEHSLHLLVTAGALLGLLVFLEEERAEAWWLACLVAEPLVRFEGMGVLAGCLAVVALRGRWRLAGGVAAAAAGCLLAYVLAMRALGLPPLPSSVLVKSASAASGSSGELLALPLGLLKTVWHNVVTRAGLILVAGALALGSAVVAAPRLVLARGEAGTRAGIALAGFLMLAAHLALGSTGWFERYEIYALLAAGMGVVVLARAPLARALGADRPFLAVAAALGAIAVMTPYATATFLTGAAARNVYLQQYQMHRFVTEYLRGPVAVNDLGWVAYRNDAYVLDLWGLGSEAARIARAADNRAPDPSAAWLDRLARENGADLAMIYDSWLPRRPATWVRLGQLNLGGRVITSAGDTVAFYATRPGAAPDLTAKMRAFANTLPAPASLTGPGGGPL